FIEQCFEAVMESLGDRWHEFGTLQAARLHVDFLAALIRRRANCDQLGGIEERNGLLETINFGDQLFGWSTLSVVHGNSPVVRRPAQCEARLVKTLSGCLPRSPLPI